MEKSKAQTDHGVENNYHTPDFGAGICKNIT